MVKKGDTLIEVTLAVGIFSLVAVAVVAVVNNSTSGAQASLETTLAREEIDAQAEALRFIQSSYVNSNTATDPEADNKYKELWKKITSYATTATSRLDYTPATCQELYEKSIASGTIPIVEQNAFIINPKKLGYSDIDAAVISARNSTNFYPASTYPRIIYTSEDSDNNALLNANTNNGISRIEGIYIIAIKGPKTLVVGSGGSPDKNTSSAYYDFYIRSCWYGPGANTPSTISTVMRLYDPDVVQVNPPK